MTETPFIDVRGLAKRFGPKRVLEDVSFSVQAGESLVLIGTSGSGKTLLLKCLLGLIKPNGGEVIVGGEDTVRLSGDKRDAFVARTGMLFQRSGLFDSLPVWQNVAFRLIQSRKVESAAARDLAIDKLLMVGLDPHVADLSPSELSGGMQKRVGIARAICDDPELLLLDEPTAGLAPLFGTAQRTTCWKAVTPTLINSCIAAPKAPSICRSKRTDARAARSLFALTPGTPAHTAGKDAEPRSLVGRCRSLDQAGRLHGLCAGRQQGAETRILNGRRQSPRGHRDRDRGRYAIQSCATNGGRRIQARASLRGCAGTCTHGCALRDQR